MVHTARRRREAAITLVELLVVGAVTSVLLALLLASFGPLRQERARRMCVDNLARIGLAFRQFASQQAGRFPSPDLSKPEGVAACFLSLTQHLNSPKLLVCPADTRKSARRFADLKDENISYFVGLDAAPSRPQTLLAGHRHLTINRAPVKPGLLVVGSNDVLHPAGGHPACVANVLLADGSVQPLSPTGLRAEFLRSGVASNRLLFP